MRWFGQELNVDMTDEEKARAYYDELEICSKEKRSSEILEGRKNDMGKEPWHLLPLGPVREVVRVLAFGAKNAADNWQSVENPLDRYYAALMRHVVAWRSGERMDPETGIHHLAHAATNVVFLLWFEGVK